ncbi:MAG: Gx transporter family protein [Candidatus Latescibacterota bacterium]
MTVDLRYLAFPKGRKLVYLALLASVGLILFIFEGMLPRPFPWMKIGLGNVVSLLALFMFGAGGACAVTGIRVVLGSLLVGTFLSPTFLLSAGGAAASWAVMALVHRTWPRSFGVVGVSVWGAWAHNVTQLSLAYLLLVRSRGIWALFPIFLLSSVATGLVTGVAAYGMLERLKRE